MEGISLQSHSRALGDGAERRGDGGRRRSMEWDSSWECLNFPPRVESPESSRAVTPIPCCRPAATVACWKGRLLGRIVDGDCGAAAGAGRGSRASAMPTSPSRPDPTSAHAHPLSLPPRANHFAAPTLPFLLGGGISSTWIESCLYPSLGLFIHPRHKVKNPITYTQ